MATAQKVGRGVLWTAKLESIHATAAVGLHSLHTRGHGHGQDHDRQVQVKLGVSTLPSPLPTQPPPAPPATPLAGINDVGLPHHAEKTDHDQVHVRDHNRH